MYISGKWTVIVLLVIVLSLAAGCITPQTQNGSGPVELIPAPAEMQENLTTLITAEQTFSHSMLARAATLQTLILSGDGRNPEKIRTWLHDYYTQFPLIDAAWYYNAQTGDQISTHLENKDYNTLSFPRYQESDFTSKRSIFAGPVYVKDNTYLITLAVPLYNEDGSYHGYAMEACDPYVTVKYLYTESGADGSYIFYLIRPDGTILYSTRSYIIGNSIDDVFEGFGLEKILFTNTSGALHYETPYADYFGYVKQMIPVTGAWKQATYLGEPVAYLITRPDNLPENPIALDPGSIRISDKNKLMETARSAVSYANTHTRQEALSYINTLDEECRIMAFTFSGDLLADSLSQKYVGSNYRSMRDVYGVRTVREMIFRAQHGGGFCSEYYPVADLEVPQTALFGHAYVLPVGDATSWFIVALSPLSKDVVPVNTSYRDAVVYPVFDIAAFIRDHGKDVAIQEMQKPDAFTSNYTEGKRFGVVALDYEGTILASSLHPEDIGASALAYTDMQGSSIGREVIMLAKNGGGTIYMSQYDTEERCARIYMLNVVDAGDDWFYVTIVRMDEVAV